MRKGIDIVVKVLSMAVLLIGITWQGEAQEWNTYSNKDFSISYSKSWEIVMEKEPTINNVIVSLQIMQRLRENARQMGLS